jgi:hypothetical protein
MLLGPRRRPTRNAGSSPSTQIGSELIQVRWLLVAQQESA